MTLCLPIYAVKLGATTSFYTEDCWTLGSYLYKAPVILHTNNPASAPTASSLPLWFFGHPPARGGKKRWHFRLGTSHDDGSTSPNPSPFLSLSHSQHREVNSPCSHACIPQMRSWRYFRSWAANKPSGLFAFHPHYHHIKRPTL